MIGRLTTWRMVFDGMRRLDGNEMGLLKNICDLLDQAWEDFIYDRATELPTLLEVNNISTKWLQYLKSLLGFTRDLSFDATEAELRRILTRAVAFWNEKPTELGVITHAIRMVTGNRFRVRNFFDLRMVVDECCLGEELEDFDPHLLDFPSKVAKNLTIQAGQEAPGISEPMFLVTAGLSSQFQTESDYAYLVISSPEEMAGTYKIARTAPYSLVGYVQLPLGQTWPAITETCDAELYGTMDEFTSDVHLVDEGSGTLAYDELTSTFAIGDFITGIASGATAEVVGVTETSPTAGVLELVGIIGRFQDAEDIIGIPSGGDAVAKGKLQGVLNRELLRLLMEMVRPSGERIDLRYIAFLDQFEVANDLDQWTVSGGTALPLPGGEVNVPVGARLLANPAEADVWRRFQSWFKFRGWETLTAHADCVVHYINDSNFHFVRFNWGDKTVKLYERAAGVDSLLASAGPFPHINDVDTQIVLRLTHDVDVDAGADVFQVHLDNERIIDVSLGTPTDLGGGVAFRSLSGGARLKMVEVDRLPIECDHVGPPPDVQPVIISTGGGGGGA